MEIEWKNNEDFELLGIRAREEVDWKNRNLAGRIMSVPRTKLGESLKEEKGCKYVLYGDLIELAG